MTIPDVTALSGDPLADMSDTEWVHDMVTRLTSATPTQRGAWLREMTDDEYDMVRPLIEGLPS